MLPDGRIPPELQARSLRERGDLEKVGGLVSDHWNHWAVIVIFWVDLPGFFEDLVKLSRIREGKTRHGR